MILFLTKVAILCPVAVSISGRLNEFTGTTSHPSATHLTSSQIQKTIENKTTVHPFQSHRFRWHVSHIVFISSIITLYVYVCCILFYLAACRLLRRLCVTDLARMGRTEILTETMTDFRHSGEMPPSVFQVWSIKAYTIQIFNVCCNLKLWYFMVKQKIFSGK